MAGDSWGFLVSHPADFTMVCNTEIGKTDLLYEAFQKRNIKVIAVSVDDLASHNKWVSDIDEVNDMNVNFSSIADENRVVSLLYDMIHPNTCNKPRSDVFYHQTLIKK